MKLRKVLFLSADQWRAEALSILGHPLARTPNLDALARDGVQFRNHYAATAPCGPARTSMLTGLHLMNHRCGRNGTPVDARFTNLALEARKAGIEPTLFGYTDTAPDPRRFPPGDPALTTYENVMPGFSVGLQLPDHMAPWIADLKARGYDLPEGRWSVYKPAPGWKPKPGQSAFAAPARFAAEHSETEFMAEAILRFLSLRRREDWLVHGVFLRPHPPFIAPEPYCSLIDPADVPAPTRRPTTEEEGRIHPYLADRMGRQGRAVLINDDPVETVELSERDIRQIRATYFGLIAEADAGIGRILQHLKETGEYDETLIVFTVDHGEMLGDHWLWGKEGYHDASYHIPLIIRDPRPSAARGTVIEDFTEAVDLMPTILDWLGLEVPLQCDGESLLPFLEGRRPATWRSEAHFEYDFRDIVGQRPETALGITSDQCYLSVIRDRDWKYVHFPALPPLLFNLREDPDEFVNRAEDPACRDVMLRYAQKMLSWRMEQADRTLARTHLTENGPFERRGPRR
jgi:arylsulfatase A-like enzyme